MLTLSLYSTLMLLQLRMEGSTSTGMGRIFITFSLAEGGMGTPTSLKRSEVWSLLFPRAKKLCLLYTQYLGLISRDELFSMKAITFNPSPAKTDQKCENNPWYIRKMCSRVNINVRALTLEETCFFKIHIHGYCS